MLEHEKVCGYQLLNCQCCGEYHRKNQLEVGGVVFSKLVHRVLKQIMACPTFSNANFDFKSL